ncbi:hypothetical protein HMPREF9120_02388 [Neisseria sp. oral taxon 020 str. F0370]|nr:hypothetical protein HMPREF9120_02388 [Neisseria sp. oral taxon 020 str. F0370]
MKFYTAQDEENLSALRLKCENGRKWQNACGRGNKRAFAAGRFRRPFYPFSNRVRTCGTHPTHGKKGRLKAQLQRS